MGVAEPGPDEAIRMIVTDLSATFTDVDPTEITAVAREEFDSLSGRSKAPAFVGILSERRARDRLLRTYPRSA